MEKKSLASYKELEEGEILNDDPEELYTPLERPHIPSNVNIKVSPQSESDEDNQFQETSSDSDSSPRKSNPLKTKTKIFPRKPKEPPAKKKKNYNIWCNDLQAEVLTNCLVDCSVDNSNERVRDVESYNYKLGSYNESDKSKNNYSESSTNSWKRYLGKRKHDGGYSNNKIPTKGENSGFTKSDGPVANPRNILKLNTSSLDSNEDIAKDIANKLYEEKEELVLSALNVLGKEPVISLFEKTRKIEASGGMLVMNGTRRRTPGGVFFYLLKTSETIPRDKINLVLSEDKKARSEEKKLSAKKMREIKAAKFKKALSKDDFPVLLSRTELAIKEFKAKKQAEDSGEVKNPPPSPVTDGRDCSSDGEEQKEENKNNEKFSEGRSLTSYDDNLFENEDTMEIF